MTELLQVLLLIVGFVLLIKGADFMVEGASALAKKMKISELVIGLTIISFGTSAPELVVNVISAFEKSNGLVFGNVIGSNLFNVLLVLGVAGLIAPLEVGRGTVYREIPFVLLVSAILYVLVNDNTFDVSNKRDILSRGDGIILLAFFLIFLAYVYALSKESFIPEETIKPMAGWLMALYIIGGMAGLLIGGDLVVDNAVKLAKTFGVSERLIGLTVVAAGTSLPELATSAVASYKGKTDIAIGNVVGSNIFNILLILGVSASIHPTYYDKSLNQDMLVMIATSFLLFIFMFTGKGGKAKKLNKPEATVFLLIFLVYMGYIIYRG